MSKIPEGATHKTSRGEYRRIVGDDVYVCSGDNWVCVYSDPRAREGCIPVNQEWSGEDLPPVGSIVFCGTHNLKVEILKDPELVPYVSAPCRALDNNELFWGGNFTPIKTPEQVAADDRKAAIDAMSAIMDSKAHLWTRAEQLGALYDAGLRFAEVEK